MTTPAQIRRDFVRRCMCYLMRSAVHEKSPTCHESIPFILLFECGGEIELHTRVCVSIPAFDGHVAPGEAGGQASGDCRLPPARSGSGIGQRQGAEWCTLQASPSGMLGLGEFSYVFLTPRVANRR